MSRPGLDHRDHAVTERFEPILVERQSSAAERQRIQGDEPSLRQFGSDAGLPAKV
jgi:hypothetical protein